jgi:hypothetical protein
VSQQREQCCERPWLRPCGFNLVNDTMTEVCENCGTVTEPYAPEVGQAVFGNPSAKYDFDAMPDHYAVEAMLQLLGYFTGVEERYAPISNTVFEMRPYYWGDDEGECDKPNFRHRESGLEIRWYKHIGRGMSVNKHVCPKCFLPIFAECMNSLREVRP